MNDNEKALIWLDNFDFATYKKKEKIIEIVKEPKNLLSYNYVTAIKQSFLKILSIEEYDIFIHQIGDIFVNKVLDDLDKLKIGVITRYSSDYPEELKNIDTPPFVLYYKGNKELLSTSCFAVVGTRHITSYGKAVTEKFVRGLSLAGFTIVSGLASGVDSVAHTETLKCNGKTIGVLAGGLDEIYPASNTDLAKKMTDSGSLIISEIRPTKRPESFMFPIRNRIISALSKGILITEAQEKSGVIHTKNYALEYGKDVFAVPGSIFNLTSVGANRMIVNSQAKAVIDVQDILCEYNVSQIMPKQNSYNLSMEESIIIELLRNGEKTFQELVDNSKIEVKRLNTLLTMLSIRGIIKKLAGNVYFLN